MALWQFQVFAALIGAVLVYTSILARRVGCTNARLKRIEEAVLELDGLLRHANTRAGAATPHREVFSGDGRAAYLTIRDLKARSELLSSRATRSSNENSIAITPVSRNALKRSSKPLSSPGTRSAHGDSVAMDSESRGALETGSEPTSSPRTRSATGESAAKRDRDALFIILSSQRRRRRAREGY